MAINKIKVIPSKTYKTEAHCEKAIQKKLGYITEHINYFIVQNEEGRFYPIFIGQIAIRYRIYLNFIVVS